MVLLFVYYGCMSRTVGEAPDELACSKCGEIKLTSEFPVITARRKKRYHSYCYDCQNRYARDFRARDIEASRARENAYYRENAEHKREVTRQWRAATGYDRKNSLKRLYGITLQEYQVLLDAQNGVCAVCGEPPQGKRKFLAVDHDHETGQIRGLLCTTCNVGLGALRDSLELLHAALAYLEGSL